MATLTASNINNLSLSTASVEWNLLNYAVIAGKTTSDLAFKIIAHAKPGNKLLLSYVEVFKADGTRYKYGTEITAIFVDL